MKKLISLFLFIACMILTSYAQNTKTETVGLDQLIGPSGVYAVTVDTYKGSPYFPTDFVKGYIMIDKQTRTKDLLLRYNKSNNNIEFIRKDDIYLVRGNKIKGFVILAEPFNIAFRNGFKTNKDSFKTSTLVRVVYDGKIKLLAHQTSVLLEDIPSYGVAGDVNEYVSKTEYFLVTKNGVLHNIKLTKNDVLNTLANNKAKLLSFVSNNNFEFSNEQHLKKILAYYELLQEAQ